LVITGPRPRDLDVREGPQFLEYRRRIAHLIFGGADADPDSAPEDSLGGDA
jgi:hypothetical protein